MDIENASKTIKSFSKKRNEKKKEREERMKKGQPDTSDIIRAYWFVLGAVIGIIIFIAAIGSLTFSFIVSLLNISFGMPIFIIFFLIIFLIWLALSLKVISAEEMAVKEILGIPVSFCNSGLHFVPLFFKKAKCRLRLFSKKMYNLDYLKRMVYSKAGDYKGVDYGAQELKVDSVAYIKFPRDKNLITVLQAGIPTKDEQLKDWTEEIVMSALRASLGTKTWKESTEKTGGVINHANKEFTDKKKSPLILAGFKKEDIKLAIVEIDLPPYLAKSLVIVDEQRLKKDAASYKATQNAKELVGSVIQMIAEATNKSPEEIKAEIENDENLKKKFREYSQELIKRKLSIDGKSFTHIHIDQIESLKGKNGESGGLGKDLINLLVLLEVLEKRKKPDGKTEESKKTAKNKTQYFLDSYNQRYKS